MLSEQEITKALHASRVVSLPKANFHGPLGLEHLAAYVSEIMNAHTAKVQRPLELSPTTWEKLEHLANSASKATAEPISVSDIVAAMVEQFAASGPGG
jgi:hypothetical protein